MVTEYLLATAALAVDRIVGDPPRFPHPVRAIGAAIAWIDQKLNRGRNRRGKGVGLALALPLASGLAAWGVIFSLARLWVPLGWIVTVLLIATTIAWKSLMDAGREVYTALRQEGLSASRQKVAHIVGRDTDHLDQAEVVRATVETLAENIVDGFISPLFYAALGGAPLAVSYRAINTLDSMVGYRNDRYREFGWASARLDDWANWIPARITALILLAVFPLLGYSSGEAWRVMRGDAPKHPSPNGGIPESLVAGALGVQLGGLNYYHGIPSDRARMGQANRPLEPEDIPRTIRIVEAVGIFSGFILLVLGVWLR